MGRFICEAIRCFFSNPPLEAPLYKELARQIEFGDVVITFNYELALERQLRLAKMEGNNSKLELPDGYGFGTNPDVKTVTVLKLHGSVNWLGQMFGGVQAGDYFAASNSLGTRPVLEPRDQQYLDYPETPPIDPNFKGGGRADRITLNLANVRKAI